MDLWIRSQDRKDLVKVNALWIMDNQIWMEVPFYDNHKKLGLTVTNNNHRLAVYKTQQRALEVLDEIQYLLKPQLKITTPKIDVIGNVTDVIATKVKGQVETYLSNNLDHIVYEMPLE